MIAFIAGSELVVLPVLLLLGALGLVCTAFWIFMLVHAIRNDRLKGTQRLLWVASVWFLPFLGSIFYFFFGRRR